MVLVEEHDALDARREENRPTDSNHRDRDEHRPVAPGATC